MLKYYARTFLPWIVLAVGSGFDNRAGALAGLATAVALIVVDRRAGRRMDELILELSTAVFMAAFAVFAVALPGSPILDYGTSLSMGWLALVAWAGLVVRRPFTLGIARRQVAEPITGTSQFLQFNMTITLVWAVCFTLEALTLAVVQHYAPHALPVLIVCKVGFLAAAAIFTARYSALAQRRAVALEPSL
ncbi:hypothetical protein [Nocardia vermiculata]|uniref:Intracellular septation protein A n=1 Tax=Nocardia vermiculata TaxID=257274 RepID=A0A846XTV6_9NOCA|nr:hypothetical protein [Nocardia vermiculata]NKY50057.1 hypothetical protein [Nocardia vermiculata]